MHTCYHVKSEKSDKTQFNCPNISNLYSTSQALILNMEVFPPQPVQMVASNVPAFLAKLWKMVDDPETNHLIEWGDEGNSFVIHNHGEFEQTLLPYYYKHSNMASFVRQLNMYGFHKKVGIDSGGLKSEHVEEQEFYHPYFLRGQEHLLENIKVHIFDRWH